MLREQLPLLRELDLYNDKELKALRGRLDARYERMRNLVLKGRVPREVLDPLNKEREDVKAEAEKRGL